MKTTVWVLMVILVLGGMTWSAAADPGYDLTYTFQPSDPDMQDLPHKYYYEWRIEWSPPGGLEVISAELSIDDLYDWKWEPDILYFQLLDHTTTTQERKRYWDGHGGSDAFANYHLAPKNIDHLLLATYSDPQGGWANREDWTYTFTDAQVAALNDYIANDAVFGLGLDPDCHYYNSGITLTVQVTPELPPSALLGLSMLPLGIAYLRGRRRKES